MANTKHDRPDGTQSVSARIESRAVVSEPTRVIQVEHVRISQFQKSAVASALRAGRAAGGKK